MSQPNKDTRPPARKHTRPDDVVIRLEQRMRQLELELDKAKSINYELQNCTAAAPAHVHGPLVPGPHETPEHSAADDSVQLPPSKQPRVAPARNELKNQAREQGGLFCIQNELFLRGGARLFNSAVRRNYSPAQRYDPTVADGLVQGQLHEIHDTLPLALQPYEHEPWFTKAFAVGVRTQRAQAVNRIKNVSAPLIFGVSANDLLDPEHKLRLKALIGYIADPAVGPHYSIFDVPLLHKDHTPTLDRSKLFMSDELIKIYIAIIRALGGLRAYSLNQTSSTNARATLEEMHGISRPTEGAIAGAAVLGIFCLSLDPALRMRGPVTKIDYYGLFNEYKHWLRSGLDDNKLCVINIFRYWQHAIFPTAPPIRRNPAIDWIGQERARAMAVLKDDVQAPPEAPEAPEQPADADAATHQERAGNAPEQSRDGAANSQEPPQANAGPDDAMDASSELSYVDDGPATTPAPGSQTGSQPAAASMDIDDANSQPYTARQLVVSPAKHVIQRSHAHTQVIPSSPPESPVVAPAKKASNLRRGTRRGRGGH
ncbi:hypothetical protein AURDEDRAFT_128249 [Auricularia subglabra TFB-10046 SS5]|nr:hypothetical protein AURDEDRAFT_128249 [Auricularia subglabra TFB-10046 SS5]